MASSPTCIDFRFGIRGRFFHAAWRFGSKGDAGGSGVERGRCAWEIDTPFGQRRPIGSRIELIYGEGEDNDKANDHQGSRMVMRSHVTDGVRRLGGRMKNVEMLSSQPVWEVGIADGILGDQCNRTCRRGGACCTDCSLQM